MHCSNCGRQFEEGTNYCPQCGASIKLPPTEDLEEETSFCWKCGTRLSKDSNYCSECGTSINDPSTPLISGYSLELARWGERFFS